MERGLSASAAVNKNADGLFTEIPPFDSDLIILSYRVSERMKMIFPPKIIPFALFPKLREMLQNISF